jgi:hypothetical protein
MPMADARDFAKGRRLLQELLPWARAEARKGDHDFTLESALAKATASYVREDNLDAVMIYPAPKGGWHADVVFKYVPPGIPNTMGTPVEHPRRTRAEAEAVAKDLLVTVLRIAETTRGKARAAPVFMLHGWTLRLPRDLLPSALAVMPEFHSGYGTQLQAAARVERVLDELCPEGFDGSAFNDWPIEKKVALVTVLSIATLSGLFVWPWRRDGTPDPAEEPTQ